MLASSITKLMRKPRLSAIPNITNTISISPTSQKSGAASWLLDLTAISLLDQPSLERFSGRVSDSGEGRWTIIAGIESGAPASVLTESLYERFTSRGESDFASKLLSAMRFQFGGHVEKKS